MKVKEEKIIIPESSYTKTTYIAEDGKEFCRKEDCIGYENKKRKEEIEKRNVHSVVDYDLPDFGNINWYYCKTQEALGLTLSKYDRYTHWKNKDIAKVGEWFGILYEDGGDHRGTTTVFSLEESRLQLEKFLKKIETAQVNDDE